MVEHNIELIGTVIIGILGLSLIVQGYFIASGRHQYRHTEREKENFNFYTPYYLRCQFICMNYTEPTDFMRAYVKKFGKCSLILKPYKLRYKPILIKAPLKQSKKVSFAPKKVTTPFYSITY